MNEQEFAELAAGHALNALSPEDERSYIAALAAHPEWSEIAEQDAATAAVLAGGVAQIAPPLGARGALMSLIARSPQAPPRPPSSDRSGIVAAPGPATATATAHDQTPDDLAGAPADAPAIPAEPTPTDVVQTVARRHWMRGVFALAASLTLLITLGFGAALVGQQISRSPAQIALERVENAPDARTAAVAATGGGQATAHWSESLGEVVLVTDGLPALASDQTYQMWFVRDGGNTIESGGLFATDAEGEATSLLDGEFADGDVIAVSVEPGGGSGQPTTTPIVAIPTST